MVTMAFDCLKSVFQFRERSVAAFTRRTMLLSTAIDLTLVPEHFKFMCEYEQNISTISCRIFIVDNNIIIISFIHGFSTIL